MGLKNPEIIEEDIIKAIQAGIKNSFIFIGSYSLNFGYNFEINNFVKLETINLCRSKKKETKIKKLLKMKLRVAYKKFFGIKVKGKTGNIDMAINNLIKNNQQFLENFFNMDVKECLTIFISENQKINIEGKEESIYGYKNPDYEYHKFNENKVKEIKKQIEDLYNNLPNNKIKSKKEKSCQEKTEENSENEQDINNVKNLFYNRERKQKSEDYNINMSTQNNSNTDLTNEKSYKLLFIVKKKKKMGCKSKEQKDKGENGDHNKDSKDIMRKGTIRKVLKVFDAFFIIFIKKFDNKVEVWSPNIPNRIVDKKELFKASINKTMKDIYMESTTKNYKAETKEINQKKIESLYNKYGPIRYLLNLKFVNILKLYVKFPLIIRFGTIIMDFEDEENKKRIEIVKKFIDESMQKNK